MSQVKFSNFEIGRKATTSAASSEDANFPHQNLFYGSAGLTWRTAAQVTASTITLDLGGGNELSADHAIFSGANAMIAQSSNDVDIELRASTDNFSASDVLISSVSNLQQSDLVGAAPDEIVLTFAASTAYRYWRIKILSTASIYHTLRKASFGTFFTFGNQAPAVNYSASIAQPRSAFNSNSGQMFGTSLGRRPYVLNYSYANVTDTIRTQWETDFRQTEEFVPVYVYQPTGEAAQLISEKTVLLGRITNVSVTSQFKNTNRINFQFAEDVNA